jgi:MSHA biogenesis protein MshE
MQQKKIRLGELLVKSNIIDEKQLEQAIAHQKSTGERLGDALMALGYISEKTFLSFLSEQLNIPLIDLKKYNIDLEKARDLPEAYARNYHAVLLSQRQGKPFVGMADPLDITATDEISKVLGRPIETALVSPAGLNHILDAIYRRTQEIADYAEALQQEVGEDSLLAELDAEDDTETSAPVIKLLQSMFEDAIQVGASDIHIEPDEHSLRLRLRVDGVLQEHIIKKKNIASAIALKLKLMANLNIAERRLPQDGRFNIKISEHVVDIRLSTMPIKYGESIVMRLLDQSGSDIGLENIGMPEDTLKRFRSLLKEPHGVILVTGPTGSGKSTTLYGGLQELDTPGINIISIEDPIEYQLPRINQVQVNEKLELTFARVLRTTLRQDPDIIMVGEMRDEETAVIAMRAALTGHLVLSTLHTNDSASTALRLIDMGVEGFFVAAVLRGVLAQRLVRKICTGCSTKYQLTEHEKAWLDGIASPTVIEKANVRHGAGCTYCNNTGYKGRIGVFELLELDASMMEALRKDDPSAFYKAAEIALKGQLLVDNGLALVNEGVTTVDEIIKISGET